jgi:protein gp37
MSDKTGISWTDATWNPVVGCTKVSAGCDHCYAIRTAHRMAANPNPLVSQAYAGTEAGGEWTGKVNLLTDRLDQPLKWRRPRRIFVNAQSDLFHEAVPDDFITRAWAVMTLAPQHVFQVLTKRHARMRSLLTAPRFQDDVWRAATVLMGERGIDKGRHFAWPLPNVWLGVSVEDQQWADIRIPALLDTPAAVRWLSCEPLLGPVDLRGLLQCFHCKTTHKFELCDRMSHPVPYGALSKRHVDWVVVGGESGPGARPMHPAWARSLRDQCQAAGVPFHFKQWGEWAPSNVYPNRGHLTDAHCVMHPAGMTAMTKSNPFNPFERGHPNWGQPMRRVGKASAGRELDGRTWDEYPA